MNRFERVLEILDQAIGGPREQIGVHGAFWRGLSRDQVVARKVRGRDLLVLDDGRVTVDGKSKSRLVRIPLRK